MRLHASLLLYTVLYGTGVACLSSLQILHTHSRFHIPLNSDFPLLSPSLITSNSIDFPIDDYSFYKDNATF